MYRIFYRSQSPLCLKSDLVLANATETRLPLVNLNGQADKTISTSSNTLSPTPNSFRPVTSRQLSDLEVSKIRSALFCSLYARPSPTRQGNCTTRLGSDIAYKHHTSARANLTSLSKHSQYRVKTAIHTHRRHVTSGRSQAREGAEVATDGPEQNALPISLLLEPTCAAIEQTATLEINQRRLPERSPSQPAVRNQPNESSATTAKWRNQENSQRVDKSL